MKKTIKTIFMFTAFALVFVFCSTMQGEGYFTLEAILNRSDNRCFLSAMEKENYTEAAEYLSFYGKEDKAAARREWADNMENIGFSFSEIKFNTLFTDDGITLCPVTAILDDGRKMQFRVVIQDRGLAVSNIHIDSSDEETLHRIMTTYHPG